MIRKLLAAALSATAVGGAAGTASAQFGPLTNGSLDPFNKNNSLGGSIQTPFIKPTLPTRPPADSGSQLAVQSFELDEDGYFVEVSPHGKRTATGKRGVLLRDAKTGKAFWEYTSGGQRYTRFAAAKWQAVLDEREKPKADLKPAAQQVAARTLFRTEGSQFQARGGGKWVEKRDSGVDSSFTETGRTNEYVELYDADRQMWVRLHADRGEFYTKEAKQWQRWSGSQGGWTK